MGSVAGSDVEPVAGPGVRFRVLGPLEFDGTLIGSPKQAIVLAVLLAAGGRPVSRDRLVDALWGDSPPASADSTLRWHVHRLRRTLEPGGLGDRLRRDGTGHRLHVEPGELDAELFGSLVLEGDRLFAVGSFAACSPALASALALWHGPAYAGLEDVAFLSDQVVRLEELHARAFEQHVDAELELGHPAELVAPLSAAVAEHPWREGLCGRLMIALHRSGRQAEALEVYRSLRTTLAEELGLDPGPELRRIHHAVLSGELPRAASDPGPALVHPAELPPDNPAFTGRSATVEGICADLTADTGGPLRVVALSGAGGAGKSTLAVHVAHRVSTTFPDGVLYVDLRGSTPGVTPLEPGEILGRILRSASSAGLAGPAGPEVPTDLDEAAGRFRTLTADRRLLVVLDNAASPAQIRPLLPGSPRSAVLLTGRRAPTELDGAVHHEIGALSEPEAVRLLSRLAGDSRVSGEPEAAVEVVRLCALQAMAVSIAGARLMSRAAWSVRDLADRLADKGRRLDELSYGDRPIRAGLDLSIEELGPCARRLLVLLGAVDLDSISPPVAAALASVPERDAADLLDELVDARLAGAPLRDLYALHDLVRLRASSLAGSLSSEDRTAAVERVLHFYLATARSATVLIAPGSEPRTQEGISSSALSVPGLRFDDVRGAIAWVDHEVRNLVAIGTQASDSLERQNAEHSGGLGRALIGLSTAIDMPFNARGYWQELIRLHESAVGVATSIDHLRGAARAHGDLGYCYAVVGRDRDAYDQLETALALWTEIGDRHGQARTCNLLGLEHIKRQEFALAVDRFGQSLAHWRATDSEHLTGPALANLGLAYQRWGQHRLASDYFRMAARAHQEVGNRHAAGIAYLNLGEACRSTGDLEAAIGHLTDALDLLRAAGSRANEAEALWYLGHALFDRGDEPAARKRWRAALHILEEIGLISGSESGAALAETPPATPDAILRL